MHCPIFFDQPHFNLVTNACVDVRFPNHTAFPNFFASSLKLRLDERNQLRVDLGEGERPIEHFGKADEACIAYDEVDGFWYMRLG